MQQPQPVRLQQLAHDERLNDVSNESLVLVAWGSPLSILTGSLKLIVLETVCRGQLSVTISTSLSLSDIWLF